MNFVGHCFVAAWRRGVAASTAPYAFGAMLPDFTAMCGLRGAGVDHALTAEGQALHHETDRAFHHSQAFVALESETLRDLEGRGVRRGTAMAVAHVGVELLLDGWLLAADRDRGGAVGSHYLRALDAGEGLVEHLRLTPLRRRGGAPRSGEGASTEPERLRGLIGRLRSYGLDGHEDLDAIAMRLERALAHRPRLCIEPIDAPKIREALPHCQAKVHQRADRWMQSLRATLAIA